MTTVIVLSFAERSNICKTMVRGLVALSRPSRDRAAPLPRQERAYSAEIVT